MDIEGEGLLNSNRCVPTEDDDSSILLINGFRLQSNIFHLWVRCVRNFYLGNRACPCQSIDFGPRRTLPFLLIVLYQQDERERERERELLELSSPRSYHTGISSVSLFLLWLQSILAGIHIYLVIFSNSERPPTMESKQLFSQ